MNHKVYFAIVLWVVAITAGVAFAVFAPWWAIFGFAGAGLTKLAMSLTKRGDVP